MADRLPPPPFWRLPYFERQMARPDRALVRHEDVAATMAAPTRTLR